LKVANSEEDQTAVLDPLEAHSTKSNASPAARVIGKDDLIGREGYLPGVCEDDKRPWRTVLDDRQLRNGFWFAIDAGTGNELDE